MDVVFIISNATPRSSHQLKVMSNDLIDNTFATKVGDLFNGDNVWDKLSHHTAFDV